MFCPLAANSSCVAASRTWPMLPGADWNFSENTVWIESTMTKRRLEPRDLLEDALEAGLRQDVERRALDAEPLAARLDLVLGLFARAVEHRAERLREVRRRLQQQRGLADARLAADQHERSRHDAAAEHAIELADPGRQPLGDDACRCRRRAAARRSTARLYRFAMSAPAADRFAPAAPRRASSRRRTRHSGPATSATGRRIPGRRRRSSVSSTLHHF